jgi:hypothetical protein
MAKKPLADAAASKLAQRQEGRGGASTLVAPRRVSRQPKSFRLGPVHLERLRHLSERLSDEAGRPSFRDGGPQGVAAIWRESRRQEIALVRKRRGFRGELSTTYVLHI